MKKKITAIMLICGLCIALSACGGKGQEENAVDVQVTEAVSTEAPSETKVIATESAEEALIDEEAATENSENAGAAAEENTEEPAAASKSVSIAGNDAMMEFQSKNGYSVVYPKKYTVVPESAEIDFVVTDSLSGSSVNVSTVPGDCSMLFDVTKEGYEQLMLSQEMPVHILDLYEITEINGIRALRIQYTYNGTEFVQTYYSISDKRTHCVTYARVAGIADDVAKEFEAITNSLKNTLTE